MGNRAGVFSHEDPKNARARGGLLLMALPAYSCDPRSRLGEPSSAGFGAIPAKMLPWEFTNR